MPPRLLILIAAPFMMAYEGWGLHVMWGWFITNVFGGVQPGVVACMGLAAIVSLVKPSNVDLEDLDVKKAVAMILNSFFRVTFVLIVGFILHFWI